MKLVEFLSPSLLASDFQILEDQLKVIEECGVKYLHYDIMDGVFVKNTTFGTEVLKRINKNFHFINDVHLMTTEPDKLVKKYAKAGANIITFHLEAYESKADILHTIELIHRFGIKAGLSIKPGTDINKILEFIDVIDLILVMSVEPGEGGQKFLNGSLEKIAKIKEFCQKACRNPIISVDGGINDSNFKAALEAGANLVVSGSTIFKDNNIKNNIKNLCH